MKDSAIILIHNSFLSLLSLNGWVLWLQFGVAKAASFQTKRSANPMRKHQCRMNQIHLSWKCLVLANQYPDTRIVMPSGRQSKHGHGSSQGMHCGPKGAW
ncbi:hypothetical protein FB45DRAFT_951668 [Roridomyces roridus]|uniref:Uncharacterized protein n=1 Tax=Roridomyces roridus TaxID=1738132 RepID=A0AAD7B049_9AGAR|nr:hypothetical protein FB45DRAFT_951668 [Roridomyces roridus]